jgi:hypothetical protein
MRSLKPSENRIEPQLKVRGNAVTGIDKLWSGKYHDGPCLWKRVVVTIRV